MVASDRILHLLKKRNIRPADAAKILDISKSTFTVWKNHPTSNIGGDILIKLADYLGVSCNYLLLGVEDPESSFNREAMKLLPYRELIGAYQKADKKSRNLARAALDLPPEK